MKQAYVAPSILTVDKAEIPATIAKLEQSGADFLHFDVMDGIFVPNKTYTFDEYKEISQLHHMINDVHLMVVNPLEYAIKYAELGADFITFHIEAVKDINEAINIVNVIHSYGKKAGISIKPATVPRTILPLLPILDLVLIMSVEPGKGGQKFLDSALDKIAFLRKYIDKWRLSTLLEVDGGINDITGKACRDKGVDILVAGSYIVSHDDLKARIDSLK